MSDAPEIVDNDPILGNSSEDPIILELIRHELISIPNQIDKKIARSAFSPLISEYKDYAVGIVDAEGKLVCQSRGSLAIFVANALGTAVKDGLKVYGAKNLLKGDIVLSNHAGTLGQHLNNVVMYTPIRIGKEEELVGFFCVVLHWIDVGGKMIGSCTSTDTKEIFQEGIQFRTVKLLSEGKRVEEIFRMIEYNTRFPTMLLGDLEAQISGCVLGCEETTKVVERYGTVVYYNALGAIWARSDELIKNAILKAKNGRYYSNAFLDDDGVNHGVPIPIKIAVEILDDKIIVDMTEVADQVEGPINAGRHGGAVAAARIALKYLLTPTEPVNDGDFWRLEVEIPDGKFLSANPTAAIGSSGVMIPTTVDAILCALAPAFPDRVAAGHHGIFGSHSLFGVNKSTGAPFFNLETAIGGWGALPYCDGNGPARSNIHGDTSNVPVEMQEAYYPIRFQRYELRADSGGAGQFRGGLGVHKTYQILDECNMNLKMDRTKCPPWGLNGGKPGEVAEVIVESKDGKTLRPLKGNISLGPGDIVHVRTGGGGGYGDPFNREIEAVENDVRLGFVSASNARNLYGVAFRDGNSVDITKTKQLRNQRSETGM